MSQSSSQLQALLDPEVSVTSFPVRAEAVKYTRGAYHALFAEPQVLEGRVLHGIAARVAELQGSAELARHHRAASGTSETSLAAENGRERALLAHAEHITVSPALVSKDDQLALEIAGVSADEIVLVSQVVAFTSFLLRALYALELLAGPVPEVLPAPRHDSPTAPSDGRREGRTSRGSLVPEAFTREVLAWEPWVPAVAEAELTPVQIDSFATKSSTNSEYFRLLARVPAVLRARSALDDAVFLGAKGIARGERELAATVASRVNDCVYCASVHSRKAAFQTKREADVDRLLAVPLERDGAWVAKDVTVLAEGQDPRWRAIVLFSARLSELTPSASPEEVEALREQAIDESSIADIAFATAFFAWANRLMLTLGEAAVPDTAA
ncbi:peroxidase-related enzyme [Leucobacter sp. UCMA 4100]|uniref:peroxidase-related enzyme n=1 Tax=Leucobacter sp. UCMA 4100 TaxID=2810534 RepID=UPI0022EA7EE9|nr:peroxidase-related enzyme [Leucobacter sp. UCMA 4100]